MKRQALRWFLIASLSLAGPLAAQPLEDLKARLAALHSDEPLRVRVDVEVRRRQAAPLSWRRAKRWGRAIVAADAGGVKVVDQHWRQSHNRILSRRNSDDFPDGALLSFEEAGDLVDPAGTLGLLLAHATVVGDEATSWQGQPARLLVVRPLRPVRNEGDEEGAPLELGPLILEARIWLNEEGDPLALERAMELRLGPALKVTEHQTHTFQQVDGRLLVAEARHTYSGKALALWRQGDARKMKVSVLR